MQTNIAFHAHKIDIKILTMASPGEALTEDSISIVGLNIEAFIHTFTRNCYSAADQIDVNEGNDDCPALIGNFLQLTR